MRVLVQHGAGLGDLVVRALRTDLGALDVLHQDDSAVVVDVDGTVADLAYASNTLEVLDWAPRGEMPDAVGTLVDAVRSYRSLAGIEVRTFRTMISVGGQLVGLPAGLRRRLEETIAAQTGGRLQARGGSDAEFWVIGRRELDRLLLCRRLSGGRSARARGALAPDLAALLVTASEPHRDDVFLDPFGGSGALVAARLAHPLRRAIYADLRRSEHDLASIAGAELLDDDALVLPSIPDGSVSAVVTDPPWGEHEALDRPYPEFAAALLTSLDRVLAPDGRLVLLVGRRVADEVAEVWDASPLHLRGGHDILVNGHPAAVLIGGR